MKPYKAKSLIGAQTRVRQLQRQVLERDALLSQWDHERTMLAKLAAETPQFFNPLNVMERKKKAAKQKERRTPPYEETCEHGVHYGGQDCFGCHPNHSALKTLRYLLS